MLRRMRKPGRFDSRLCAGRRGIAVPLSLAFFVSTAPGCNKIQELTGGKTEEAAPTEETKTEETKEETKEEAKAEPKVDPQVEAHAIPVEELDPAFFDLSTGVAGDIVQKLANHRMTATIVGALPPHSEHFAAFAREGNQLRFVPA